MIERRTFLRLGLAVVPMLGSSACSDDAQDRTFPQGVASFDPTPEGVLLWTRVEGGGRVRHEVATDPDFKSVVASGEHEVSADTDGTLRVDVALAAGGTYWYRFVAHGVTSTIGRTRTAPARDADVPLRIGLASCQDFGGRWFHAWRALVDRDDVDVVLFIGDYIYETIGHLGVKLPSDRTPEVPDGLVLEDPLKGTVAALTLADYRALYRQYRHDPDLRAAHAHFPFVMLWDDHEFANDSWGDHATDFDDYYGDEGNPERREAATRAWHEFNPIRQSGDTTQIYRSFRWGRHVEIILLDERLHRDDHLVPEGPIDKEVGHIQMNSAFGARTFVIKDAFDAREAAAAPTMLGATQRAWAIETVTASTATWKVLASPLIMAQMVLDLSAYERLPDMFRNRFYFKTDQWDGFRTERRALLEACGSVDNVVVLSGDLHGFYAAELYADFDAATEPLAVEFGVSAISAATVDVQLAAVVDANPFLEAFGLGELIPQFDANLLATNPHIRHADSVTNGFAIVELGPQAVDVRFVAVDGVTTPSGRARSEVAFRTRLGSRRIEAL
ncbi:MAG: alkaline phosphatase D family protein [Myxococcota bacterium]|nr:alkaline phosphatase D family protein [Deltaproteobacteria bacterium]MDQ3336567.1 alkaline phosphatase D family protein [Myxococcota bacterium]